MQNQFVYSKYYRWYIAAVIFATVFICSLDSNIVNIALPTISEQLQLDLTLIQWVVTAYLLTLVSLLPISGRISDIFGRKKIYILGLIFLVFGSGLCGISKNIWVLILARMTQATGASMIFGNSLAIIVSVFPASERGRALGMQAGVFAIGGMAGPPLGGLLISLAGWRAIFLVNVFVGSIVCLLALLILPRDQLKKEREPFDFPGAGFFSLAMVGILFVLCNGADWGWTSPIVMAGLILGFTSMLLFIRIEKKVLFPMIDLNLFRNMPFLIGNLAGGIAFAVSFSNAIMIPFYLQQVLHCSPLQLGLITMVLPVMTALVAPFSGRASDKIGSLKLTTAGLALMAAGMFYFSTLTAATFYWWVLPGQIFMGIGFGLFNSPNNSSVLSTIPKEKLGVAASLNSLIKNIGKLLGTVFAVILFETFGGRTNPGPAEIVNFMHAFHGVMLVATVLAILGLGISFSRRAYVSTNLPS